MTTNIKVERNTTEIDFGLEGRPSRVTLLSYTQLTCILDRKIKLYRDYTHVAISMEIYTLPTS
jgi:hypothetical protein